MPFRYFAWLCLLYAGIGEAALIERADTNVSPTHRSYTTSAELPIISQFTEQHGVKLSSFLSGKNDALNSPY